MLASRRVAPRSKLIEAAGSEAPQAHYCASRSGDDREQRVAPLIGATHWMKGGDLYAKNNSPRQNKKHWDYGAY